MEANGVHMNWDEFWDRVGTVEFENINILP